MEINQNAPELAGWALAEDGGSRWNGPDGWIVWPWSLDRWYAMHKNLDALAMDGALPRKFATLLDAVRWVNAERGIRAEIARVTSFNDCLVLGCSQEYGHEGAHDQDGGR